MNNSDDQRNAIQYQPESNVGSGDTGIGLIVVIIAGVTIISLINLAQHIAIPLIVAIASLLCMGRALFAAAVEKPTDTQQTDLDK